MTTDPDPLPPDDPRVVALAKARRGLLAPIAVPWDQLTPADQDQAAREAELWLAAAIRAGLVADSAAPTSVAVTQYGCRLRDSTLLDFETKAQRDSRMADFVAAEWEVTPLARPVVPAQYGEWTEEIAR